VRVLHTFHSIEHSGAEVMLVQSADLMRRAGIELHALATREELGRYAPAMEAAGITVHHLPLRKSPAYFLSFMRLLREAHIDIVHTNTEQAFFWFDLAAKLAGVGTIVHTVHSVFAFHGALRVERIVQRCIARTLGVRFVSPSESVAAAEMATFRNPTVVMHNWTDTELFAPCANEADRWLRRDRAGISRDATVLATIGSCLPVKNHAAAIRTVAALTRELPNVRYFHVGNGYLEDEEKRLAASLGLDVPTTFLGRSNDIPAVLKLADVLLMPSHREGLPIACIEAMSCGVPVVATRVPGLRDVVVDRKTGFLVDSEDELLEAIRKLALDPALRQAMGAAARARVVREFGLEQGVAALLAVYGVAGAAASTGSAEQ
jgi:glycosyltransferase involved in cell wall biosynthesis